MAPFDWDTVDRQKPADMSMTDWKRCSARWRAALDTLGLELMMTDEDFAQLKGTIAENKVPVTRKDTGEQRTVRLDHLLSGHTGLLTAEERTAGRARAGAKQRANKPKGQTVSNETERDAIDAIDALQGLLGLVQYFVHLLEHRRADVAYKAPEAPDAYVADQVKSARVGTSGQLYFHISIGQMVDILRHGMSLTCIGMDATGTPRKVWFLVPTDIDKLEVLPNSAFQPRLVLTKKSVNFVTKAMVEFVYDLSQPEEVARLREAKLAFVDAAPKASLAFWNEDRSQIPSDTHWWGDGVLRSHQGCDLGGRRRVRQAGGGQLRTCRLPGGPGTREGQGGTQVPCRRAAVPHA